MRVTRMTQAHDKTTQEPVEPTRIEEAAAVASRRPRTESGSCTARA